MGKWVLIFLVFVGATVRSQFTTFRVASEAMANAALNGDVVVCDRSVYGARIGGSRIWGRGAIERNDVLIFNFPEGDTIVSGLEHQNYYQLVRDHGREKIMDPKYRLPMFVDGRYGNFPIGELETRKITDKTVFIKRCVAVAGDTVEVRRGRLFVNGKGEEGGYERLYEFELQLNAPFNTERIFQEHGIDPASTIQQEGKLLIVITDQQAVEIGKMKNVISMQKREQLPDDETFVHLKDHIFPNTQGGEWSRDDFGPVWIPKKGDTLSLTLENLPIYERVISVYENNELLVQGGRIVINGEYADSYVFQQDHYWVMGDNRHRTMDSRYWGFVPFDHVIGKASFVLYNMTPDRGFRTDRLFSSIPD